MKKEKQEIAVNTSSGAEKVETIEKEKVKKTQTAKPASANKSRATDKVSAKGEAALGSAKENDKVKAKEVNARSAGSKAEKESLAAKARALGCNVTVAARKEKDHALIRMCGHGAIGYDTLEQAAAKADAICNTVPAEVFSQSVLEHISKQVPVIDLAGSITAPRVIRAPGLPGKYAPLTAGTILADSVKRILVREGIL